MTNVPRDRTTEGTRHAAGPTRWTVLAQLPDASAGALSERLAKPAGAGATEYRFDPPQTRDARPQTAGTIRPAAHQPHLFEGRPRLGQRGFPRRDSSVLPRTNPFSNPRPQLLDSIAPAVRFLTMAALFTAIGVWFQMRGHHSPAKHSADWQTTVAQPAVAPQKNADNHVPPAPTATGPIETQPGSGARVGRTEGDDFAVQRNSAAGPASAAQPSVSPPHYLISSGNKLPRVRVADTNAGGLASPAQDAAASSSTTPDTGTTDGASDQPSVARFPGFMMDNPTR